MIYLENSFLYNSEIKGSNCNCSGYSRPAVLELDGTSSTIEVMYRGDAAPQNVSNAIGAGPNLVSYDSVSQSSFVDIPSDDDNINIFEHAANTAVGLVLSDTEVNDDLNALTHY